jgi:hypothetical protein
MSKEVCHASKPYIRRPPPRRNGLNNQTAPHQLWGAFPIEHREQILGTLIRVVALQLAKAPEAEAATNERS